MSRSDPPPTPSDPARTATRLSEQSRQLPSWLSPLALLFAFSLVFAGLLGMFRVAYNTSQKNNLVAYGEMVSRNILLHMGGNEDYLRLLEEARASGDLSVSRFEELAARYSLSHPELVCFNWVDKDYVIRSVAPLAGNEQVIGLRLDLPESRRASRLAHDTGSPAYTNLFDSIQGELAFEQWVPVFEGTEFMGLLGAVYSVNRLLDKARSDVPHGNIQLAVIDRNGRTLVGPILDEGDDRDLSHEIPMLPGALETHLRFSQSGHGTLYYVLLLLQGLCFMLVLAMTYYVISLKREMRSRRAVERELKYNEELYRTLVESMADGVVLHGADGSVLAANPKAREFEEITGCSLLLEPGHVRPWAVVREDGSPLAEAEHPSRLALATGKAQNAFQLGVGQNEEERIWLSTNSRPMFRDDSSKPYAAVTTFHDVTETRRAAHALALSESKLRSILENAGFGISLISPEMEVLEMNQQMRNWFPGVNCASRPRCFEVFNTPARDTVCDGCPTFRTLLDGRVHEAITTTPAGKETFHFRVVSSPLKDPDGTLSGVIEMVSDITETLRLEEQLLQAQKLETVGRLAGGVAHDFNNMLGVIIGTADLALSQLPPDSPQRRALEDILDAADRSSRLTHRLLAYARKQAYSPRKIDLKDTLAAMLEMLRRLIGSDVELKWNAGMESLPLFMDPSQLDQVLTNLCVNARDAINGTGCITITTRAVDTSEGLEDAFGDIETNRYILLSVGDTGSGMDHATRMQIFEPFFTTKEVGKGTGLGLSTVYGIVRQNRGLIRVKSEPGQGSLFEIFLPRHLDERRSSKQIQVETPVVTGHETILVVEDEPGILALATRMLEQHGFHVLSASGPDAALEISNGYEGVIHLLLTDVVMPGMNGRDLAQRIQASNPMLRTLFMSGYASEVILPEEANSPTFQFLHKPFSMSQLMHKVGQVLETQSTWRSALLAHSAAGNRDHSPHLNEL
ncbi:MAG: response regulator [Calditrichaeota bacterium]|nr:response regulator [Calditrichota bacterium]